MRVGIFGRGRLGTAIARAVPEDWRIVWQVGRGEARPEETPDVAIDASAAEAVSAHLEWALSAGVNLVIGATGWELPGAAERVGRRIGVMAAPNFSLGAALMGRLAAVLGAFAALDPARDLYLTEAHHRRKADAPSGTARMLADRLAAACPRYEGWSLSPPASPRLLGIGVVRAGAECGTHTMGYDSPGEVLEITHRVRGREVFGEGAVAAARWMAGRRGWFRFADLADEMLGQLFSKA